MTNRPAVLVVGPGFPWTSDGGAPLRHLAILSALTRFSDCTYVGIGPGANSPPAAPKSLTSLSLVGLNAQRVSTTLWRRRAWRMLAEIGVMRPKPPRASLEVSLNAELSQGDFDVAWFMTDRVWVSYELIADAIEILDLPTVVDLVDWPGEWLDRRPPRLLNLAVPARTADTWTGFRAMRARRLDGIRAKRLMRLADAAVVSKIPPEAPSGLREVVNAYQAKPFTGARDACTSVPTLLFQGNFLYPPNFDAAQSLINQIVPILREVLCRTFNIRLVGRGEGLFQELSLPEEVSVVGYVDQMEDELERADICVVPLRYGSGTRLKILEAWSHQIPVVSTTIGADGLGAIAGTHLLIADSPEDFAVACRRAIDDAALRRHLSTSGHQLLVERFGIDTVEAQVRAIVDVLPSKKNPGSQNRVAPDRLDG